ncbi:unnamed protein product [Lactuca virosa]|uniref:Uncharacterized protein n=1 Tax=Lactuca virosa TaxID=75947 RepID=A0AAU9PA57_9ASTR|nr:unnamed protein product [Lactuca virosa]
MCFKPKRRASEHPWIREDGGASDKSINSQRSLLEISACEIQGLKSMFMNMDGKKVAQSHEIKTGLARHGPMCMEMDEWSSSQQQSLYTNYIVKKICTKHFSILIHMEVDEVAAKETTMNIQIHYSDFHEPKLAGRVVLDSGLIFLRGYGF